MTRRRRGYSLLEVLIAFVVMTLVLGALLPGQARLLARTGDAEARLLATDLALSVSDLVGLERPLTEERVATREGDWTVETLVSRVRGQGGTDLLSVGVRVLAASGQELASIETLKAAP